MQKWHFFPKFISSLTLWWWPSCSYMAVRTYLISVLWDQFFRLCKIMSASECLSFKTGNFVISINFHALRLKFLVFWNEKNMHNCTGSYFKSRYITVRSIKDACIRYGMHFERHKCISVLLLYEKIFRGFLWNWDLLMTISASHSRISQIALPWFMFPRANRVSQSLKSWEENISAQI